jgi:hypothetical protein
MPRRFNVPAALTRGQILARKFRSHVVSAVQSGAFPKPVEVPTLEQLKLPLGFDTGGAAFSRYFHILLLIVI